MSNYNSLKTLINAYIKRNGNQEITGQILNSVLNAMVQSLGNGYQFKGIAIPGESLGTPDQKVFYLAAQEGDYGDISLDAGEVAVLLFDQDWSKETLNIPSMDVVNALQAKIGQLADLDTDTKNNVVSAINEIFAITQTLGVKVKNISSSGKATQFDGAILFPDPEDEEQKINLGLRLIAIGDLIQDLEDKTHLMSATEDQTFFNGDVIIGNLIANDKLYEIGDLNELSTEEKTTLVKAINEVLSNPAITRHLFVSWGDLVSSYASTIIKLMNQYDMIVIKNRGTIITSYHDSSAVMYEYSEGWRIGSLEHLTLDSELTFQDMLEYLDEHSSFIASKRDIALVTGDLSTLQTEDKTNLVGAINEVKSDMGNLSDLQTREKTNLVSAINEVNAAKTIPDFARNLVPTGAPSEVEFSSRPTGQGVPGILGSEEVKVVKGKSLVWNQYNHGVFGYNMSGVEEDNWYKATYLRDTAKAPNVGVIGNITTPNISNKIGDKLLIYAYVRLGDAFVQDSSMKLPQLGFTNVSLYGLATTYKDAQRTTAPQFLWCIQNITLESQIKGLNTTTFGYRFSGDSMPESYGDIYCKYLSAVNLTLMFGAGNEPTTYEEFLSRKPIVEDEFAYNAGEIVNNSVKAIEVTGRNLWDEEWEVGLYNDSGVKRIGDGIRSKNYIPIADASKPYHFRFPNNDVLCKVVAFDSALNSLGVWWYIKNELNNDNAFADKFPSAKYFVLSIENYGTSYNHDICINLSDPAFNGQYVPYVAPTTIDLSWVKNIKDGDGNVLFPDGLAEGDYATQTKAVKSRFEVDLGSLSWGFSPQELYSHAARARFDAADPVAEHILALGFRTIIDGSDNYWIQNSVAGGNPCINIGGNPATGVWICISHPDYTRDNAADFVNFLRGKKLYYNTSTPIEVTYPKQETLAAIEGGGIETAIAPTEVVEHFVSGTIGDVDEYPQNNDDGNGWWTFYIPSFLGGDISGQYTPEQLSEMITIEGFSYDTSKGVEYDEQRPENGKFYLYINRGEDIWMVDIYSENLAGASEETITSLALRYKNQEDTEVTLNSAPFKGSVLYGLDVYKTLASLVASQQSEE